MQQPPNQEYPQTYGLDDIPLEEQLVIDELVWFWQTHCGPHDLTAHIRGTLQTGGSSVTSFFAKVRDDLRTDKHSKYAASSASEFRQFLEDEYRRHYQPYAERQARAKAFDEAQAKAEAERHAEAQMKAELERQAQAIAEAKCLAEAHAKAKEHQRWLRAYFDVIDKEMANTTDRKERFVLGLKRKAIAPYTGVSYVYERHCKNCSVGISSAINPRCPNCKGYICLNCDCCFCEPGELYENVCWNCHLEISSEKNEWCKVCGWYICNRCGSCKKPVCDMTYTLVQDKAVNPFLPDYPEDLS